MLGWWCGFAAGDSWSYECWYGEEREFWEGTLEKPMAGCFLEEKASRKEDEKEW